MEYFGKTIGVAKSDIVARNRIRVFIALFMDWKLIIESQTQSYPSPHCWKASQLEGVCVLRL